MKNLLIISLILLAMQVAAREEIIKLYDGKAPGSEASNWSEEIQQNEFLNTRLVYNIVNPTLTVYRAEKPTANGTAVVICPGGGFHFLAIDYEGFDVTEWLKKNRITMNVLNLKTLPEFDINDRFFPVLCNSDKSGFHQILFLYLI